MKKIKTFEGREVRGLRVKAYPTVDQQAELADIQRRIRRFWNWLVARSNDTSEARLAWASNNGAGPKPVRPTTSEPALWTAYKAELHAWFKACKALLAAQKGDPALAYRTLKDYCDHFGEKQAYNLFKHVIDEDEQPPAHLLQAMLKAYDQALAATRRGQSPPRRKKRDEDVLLQSGSGVLFRLVEDRGRIMLGMKEQGPQYSGRINCEVKLPGVTGWIACSVGKEQPLVEEEYHVQGISLRREADGWYASLRQHVVPKPPIPVGTGVCGVDVGLVHMFAVVGDDGAHVLADNTRKGSRRRHLRTPGGYVELIAERQAAGLPSSILQARAARNAREVIRRELFPFTDRYEFIAVEDLPKDIGQRGRPHISFMRTIRSMLIDRYGAERVIDVDPTDTSRTCSKCGELQPKSWSDLPGRVGKCVNCGHTEHSDLNAARNVMLKLTKPRAA